MDWRSVGKGGGFQRDEIGPAELTEDRLDLGPERLSQLVVVAPLEAEVAQQAALVVRRRAEEVQAAGIPCRNSPLRGHGIGLPCQPRAHLDEAEADVARFLLEDDLVRVG